MAMITEEEIARIKGQTDLGAVIRARGIELKAQGQDLVGLCPFHADHTPSMRVTPSKGLWRCMSCGATGNVIQFVQRFDGVSFRHAYELLKNKAVFEGAPTCQPVKKATVPKLPAPVGAQADDQAALRQVLDYYHERLQENAPALEYLRKRGISEAAIKAFRLGFVDRTLGLRLPQKNRAEGAAIRERLTRLGILRDTGHEHLRGRVVFPVMAESGEIGTVYGRAIDDGGKHDRHLFLPGPQRGIFNPSSLKSTELILTEGIIDALTFWSAGFTYVTTGYSAKALSEELLSAIIQAKVQRVFIAFDRDEAGDKGAREVAEQLTAQGVHCLRVLFPHGQDANSYALSVNPPDKALGVLLRSAVMLGMEQAREGERGAAPHPARSAAPGPVDALTLRVPASSLAAKAAKKEAAPSFAKATEGVALVVATMQGTMQEVPEKAAGEEAKGASQDSRAGRSVAASVPASSSIVPALAPVMLGAVEVIRSEAEEVELGVGDRRYRVRGLGKNTGLESLRVSLKVIHGERWHMDAIDLCVARQREAFVVAASSETGLTVELLKRELGRVLLKLEEIQVERLRGEAAKPVGSGAEAPVPSAQDKEAALALLQDPRLLTRILQDFEACGVVGEETNKLVGYLAAVSRKLDNPLAVIVQSTSAAGKSALMEAVLAFVPPEERVKYSALTGQALYYLGGEENLKHKILAIVEEEGAEKASYALKLLQSEGELSIASTGKDPHTGRMVTQEYRVEGPVMIFLTTTAVDIDDELLNRCLVLTVDEGREQTAAIHRLQRERETLAGMLRGQERSRVLNTHRVAQRLLRPLAVVNPFAERLTFLDDRTRTRRDHGKYLALIRTIALLHQYQRAVKTVVHAGKLLEYIEVSVEDIEAANRLAHETLGRCLDEMPPQTRRLLALLEKMISERCAKTQMQREDLRFSRRVVRDFTGWGDTQLKVHLGRLVELEYVITHRAEHGQGFVYELLYDGQGKDGRRFLSGLIDVEKLRAGAARKQEYDAQRSGLNEGRSGCGRPLVGGWSGAGRGEEYQSSPSENAVSGKKLLENSHLEAPAEALAS